jgi:glycosyltransferase involved in cell wall biosynthesis
MKLLITTQALDLDDPTLSAYHGWVAALAERCESVIAICLKEGRHDLPANVRVYSLGKEKGSVSPLAYAIRFLGLVWKLRREYDRVFVHMNQEYILIAGWLWEILNKPVFMWRNHYDGSWLTDLAASTCTKVFCTSKHSYTAKYKKTMLMPVGIYLTRFYYPEEAGGALRAPHSILFLARMAPSKRPEMLLEALGMLAKRSTDFTATFIGSPLPENQTYYEGLIAEAKSLGITEQVTFLLGIPNTETPDVYRSHEILVNCSKSGMFDKTLFEGAGCGCIVLAVSEDFRDAAGKQFYFEDAAGLADQLCVLFAYTPEEKERTRERMHALARAENLATLADLLVLEMNV